MPHNARRRQPIATLFYTTLAALGLSLLILLLGTLLAYAGSSCEGDGCALVSSGLIVPGMIVVIGVILAYPVLYWTLFSYELTERNITVNSGILFRQYESIDFGRIQTIDNERGPLLWLFGLTMVKIWTASADQLTFSVQNNQMHSTPNPDATLILEAATAQKVKDFIMNAKTHTSL